MLNSTSFTQTAPNASRAPSQTSKTRHRRTHSHGRRPKAERVISMSRNVSRKSDAIDARITVTPNWTKNEKYCVTRLPGRPPQIDNLGQFRTRLILVYLTCSSCKRDHVWRFVICIGFNTRVCICLVIYHTTFRSCCAYISRPFKRTRSRLPRVPQRRDPRTRPYPPQAPDRANRVLGCRRLGSSRRPHPTCRRPNNPPPRSRRPNNPFM